MKIVMKWVVQNILRDQRHYHFADVWCSCFVPCDCAVLQVCQDLRPFLLYFCLDVRHLQVLQRLNATGGDTVQIKCIDCYKPLCCNAANMPDN